eukprot:TRINITY_DN2452_c0_g1_i2.p2 TRINITY_DN2452_c0_g1~~TRINITY_DN2452_c0_g1_i2.p2  ORF type:complete len:134 (+),score=19.41 TRINITY_DN2452_c0_g1_i2:117-518(+)
MENISKAKSNDMEIDTIFLTPQLKPTSSAPPPSNHKSPFFEAMKSPKSESFFLLSPRPHSLSLHYNPIHHSIRKNKQVRWDEPNIKKLKPRCLFPLEGTKKSDLSEPKRGATIGKKKTYQQTQIATQHYPIHP